MSKVFAAGPRSRQARAGVILRHWTIDKFLFIGEGQEPSAGLANREVTDGCRLNLVAAKLKSIQAQVA